MSGSGKQPKFSEAHGKGTRACILWDIQGTDTVTAGADARIIIHKASGESVVPSVLHQKAVTSLALSPNGLLLASASIDHTVKLYSYPGAVFQTNVTRFNLPIRALAFSVTGGLLAAGGDDDGIKLISTVDNSIVRVMKGHDAPVASLAFDPKNEFLASVGTDGTVIFWSLDTGVKIHTLKHAAPDVDLEDSCVNQIAWHPSGDVLAVPGHQFDVVMYDRDTAEVHFRMRGGHNTSIGFLAWSPNGKYLATTGEDRKVMLWDAEKRLDLDRLKVPTHVCALAWKPTGNALALIDVEGRYGVWEEAVPGHLASPSAMEHTSSLVTKQELLHFSDDEADQKGISCESEDEIIGAEVDLMDDESDEEEALLKKEFKDAKVSKKVKDSGTLKVKREDKCVPFQGAVSGKLCDHKPKPQKQPSFQPGVTQRTDGTRRFLAYDLLGCIITSEGDGVNHVEVEFHDTTRGPRIAPLADYFGFTMAALSEKGSVLANPQRDKTPSTLIYRPFSSWASNSEWSMRFPSTEEVKAVAVGDRWVAAATSLDYLRIYSESGRQRYLFSLTGPVVSMAGQKQLLAVITHVTDPMDSGHQVMRYIVLDMRTNQQMLTGPLPITPGSELKWLGFSESGSLSTFDSKGVLRILSRSYGGCWVPIYSSPSEQNGTGEATWVVGLNDTQIFCIKCKAPEVQPHVHPKPVLSIVCPVMPLAHSDLGATELENELLWKSFLLEETRLRADEAASRGDEDDNDDEQLLRTEAEQDRCLLRLIAACCHGDKLSRALELASMLSLHKSLQGAVKLVSALRLPALAERINTLLEARRNADRAAVAPRQTRELMPPSSLLRTSLVGNGRQPQKLAQIILPKEVRSRTEPRLESSRAVAGVEFPASGSEITPNRKDKEGEIITQQNQQSASCDTNTPEARKSVKTREPTSKSINPFAKQKQLDGIGSGDGVSVLSAIKKLQAQGVKRQDIEGEEKISDKKPNKLPRAS
ncbi:hypothetical protein R1flu_013964 [Riccia fluitans]|uniref:Minichromosome loss protein Mcl1 middle region domain-containing protein n=1 Tax=Riccia fluitans TaxID=41844 RepID=A0ABD1YEW4_9MARC